MKRDDVFCNCLLDDQFWVGHKVGDSLEHAAGFEDESWEGDAVEVGALAELGNDSHENALATFVQNFGVLAVDKNIGVGHGVCYVC